MKQSINFTQVCLNVSNIRSMSNLRNISRFSISVFKKNNEKYCIFCHRLQKYDKMQSHTVNQCPGLLKSDNHFSLSLRKENSPHNHDSGIFREVTFHPLHVSQNLRSRGAGRVSGKAEDKHNPPRILRG